MADTAMIGRSARYHKNPTRQKRGLRFASKVVLGLFVSTVLFVVVMIVTFWVKDAVPDGLITAWFATMGGELLAVALIRVFDEMKVGTKKESKDDENNMG